MWSPLGDTAGHDHSGSAPLKTVGVLAIFIYDPHMTEVTVTQAQDRLAEVIKETRRSGEPTWVTQHGQGIAVILDSDVFDRLVDLAEDAMDRRELDEARADGDYLPWAEVKTALGLQ